MKETKKEIRKKKKKELGRTSLAQLGHRPTDPAEPACDQVVFLLQARNLTVNMAVALPTLSHQY
jgi:hypothetical protein